MADNTDWEAKVKGLLKAELKKKFGFLSMLGVGFVITGCVLYTAASVPNL